MIRLTLRFVLRLMGVALMGATYAISIVDGTRSLAAGRMMFFSTADVAGWLFPASMAEVEHQGAGSWMVAGGLVPVLTCPAWALTGVLALAFVVAGRYFLSPSNGSDAGS